MSVGIAGFAEEPSYYKFRSATYFQRKVLKARVTYPEDCLHLVEFRPWVLASQHLNHKATNTPDIGFPCVRSTLNDFGCHPIDRALHWRTMGAGTTDESYEEKLTTLSRHRDDQINLLSSTFLEIPKSEILIPPLLSTRMFAPLISRWIMSRSWR